MGSYGDRYNDDRDKKSHTHVSTVTDITTTEIRRIPTSWSSYGDRYNDDRDKKSSYGDRYNDDRDKKSSYGDRYNDDRDKKNSYFMGSYGDRYNDHKDKIKEYECRTGQFEGFLVSSVEFCVEKNKKFHR